MQRIDDLDTVRTDTRRWHVGEDVESTEFTGKDRQRYREKVRRCLDVFARMLTESKFEFERPLTGLESGMPATDPPLGSR